MLGLKGLHESCRATAIVGQIGLAPLGLALMSYFLILRDLLALELIAIYPRLVPWAPLVRRDPGWNGAD